MANEGEDHALVADVVAPTEFALMANTESKVFDNSLCSNDCKKNNDSLNSKIKDLTVKLSDANNYIYHYKLAVAQFEGRLVKYKEREVKYIEKIRTLEMYRESNLKCIKTLDKELETLKQEKNMVDGKLARLLKSSKDVKSLIESQRSDKVKEGVGYNAVPPPAADLYLSPKKDFHGLETSKKPQVKYAEQYIHSNKKPNVKGNQRNWNNLKSYQLGPEFVLNKKACFNCGDFSHLANDCRKRVKKETTMSQNHAYMSPSHRSAGHRPHGAYMRPSHRPTGHRPHGPSMNPMRPNMNGVKTQYRAPWVPTVNRNNPPVNRKFSTSRRNFPTFNRKFPTASRKFTTGSTKIHTADMGRKEKAVKPSACWVGNPSQNLSNKGPINNSVSVMAVPKTILMTKAIGTVAALDSECIVLGRNFKLLDDANILLRTPRQHNMYLIDLNNIIQHKDLTCLVAKASADECILW
nr:ribonuclease H-like domain-containing protein [Tanacetum cinerariifolium]